MLDESRSASAQWETRCLARTPRAANRLLAGAPARSSSTRSSSMKAPGSSTRSATRSQTRSDRHSTITSRDLRRLAATSKRDRSLWGLLPKQRAAYLAGGFFQSRNASLRPSTSQSNTLQVAQFRPSSRETLRSLVVTTTVQL